MDMQPGVECRSGATQELFFCVALKSFLEGIQTYKSEWTWLLNFEFREDRFKIIDGFRKN